MDKDRGVIFDMDGVLVDSEPLHEQAFRDVFRDLGFGDTHGVDFSSYYGKSDRVLWQDFIARHKPTQSLEELLECKQRLFFDELRRKQPLFPGVAELVERLSRSYRLGLASGSSQALIREVMAMGGLKQHFQALVSADDVPRGKPAPDIFLRAASLLGVEPGKCWVIEDSVAGIEAALGAGMRVIGICNSLPAERLSRATRVVKTYSEIEQLLRGGGAPDVSDTHSSRLRAG